MSRWKNYWLSAAMVALTWGGFPDRSDAQFWGGGGRGGGISIGVGRGGFGPGGYYGSSRGFYGNRGYYGNRGFYGPGSGYYGNRRWYGPGISVGIPFGNSGYYRSNYGTTYAPTIVSSPATSSYQSFYPSSAVSNTTTSDSGRGRIIVNVPANAQVTWNGSPSTLTGPTRYYSTLPLGAEGSNQQFEARWMDANGQMVTRSRTVQAMPNQTVFVDFNQPDATSGDGSQPQTTN